MLRHVVAFCDFFHVSRHTAFHQLHGSDQLRHLFLIPEVNGHVWGHAHFCSDEVNITLGVILGCWCPSRYDGRYRVFVVTMDISSKDAERSPVAIFYGDELFEILVSWVVTFTQPSIANSNI